MLTSEIEVIILQYKRYCFDCWYICGIFTAYCGHCAYCWCINILQSEALENSAAPDELLIFTGHRDGMVSADIYWVSWKSGYIVLAGNGV